MHHVWDGSSLQQQWPQLSYLSQVIFSPVWPAMTMGCMMRVKSLSSTRWRKRTRGSKLDEDREMMLSFSSCSSLFSGIFSSLTRNGNVAPPSRAWQSVKKRSRWLSWCRKQMICYNVTLAGEAERLKKKGQRNIERDRETNVTRQGACNASGCVSYYSWVATRDGKLLLRVHPLLTCVCTDDTAWISRLKSPLWLSIHLTGGAWRGSF